MISISSFFECITHSSSVSLEEMKLIAIVIEFSMYQIFLDYLWYLSSMVYFHQVFFDRQAFIFITIISIFDVIVTVNVTYSYWFVKIFFFLLKKVLN